MNRENNKKNQILDYESDMLIASKSKEIKALSIAIISGNKISIIRQIKRVLYLGVTKKEILELIPTIVKDNATISRFTELVDIVEKEEKPRRKIAVLACIKQ